MFKTLLSASFEVTGSRPSSEVRSSVETIKPNGRSSSSTQLVAKLRDSSWQEVVYAKSLHGCKRWLDKFISHYLLVAKELPEPPATSMYVCPVLLWQLLLIIRDKILWPGWTCGWIPFSCSYCSQAGTPQLHIPLASLWKQPFTFNNFNLSGAIISRKQSIVYP